MKIGQKAKLKDELGEVTIIRILKSGAVVVEDENGFESALEPSAIIVLEDDNPFTEEHLERNGHLTPRPKDKKKIKPPSFRTSSPKKRRVGERYIDLHHYALPEKYHRQLHLSKLECALSYFEDALWEAVNSPDHRLLLNHGIGEGILKEEVRKRLDAHGYQYQDESYDNPGTTVVFLKDRL